MFGNLYLAWWSDDAKRIVDEDPSGHKTYVKLGTYSALGMAQGILLTSKSGKRAKWRSYLCRLENGEMECEKERETGI